MPHAKITSTSAKQGEVDQGLISDPSRPVLLSVNFSRDPPSMGEKNPPAYGAQHRQDALWEGGNEAPPPSWYENIWSCGTRTYEDDLLCMYSSRRPLPGVRLDHFEQLIDGCEWHISPFGRSYFVNHNTRSTSWKKPAPERPAGSLMPECTIEGARSWHTGNLACLGTSGNIMSTILDGSIHQWTRAGRPVGKPLNSDGAYYIRRIAVSPDQLMVVGTICGGIRLWNIKEGLVGHPWEGNTDDRVQCFDWSPNGAEVAGGLTDGTIRRWNPATGRQIAPPIKSNHQCVTSFKYSPQGDKFASAGDDLTMRVWSKDGELLIEIRDISVTSLCWSKDGAYIFSALYDRTIRKWQSIDGKELIVFRGHTRSIDSLCLSPDGCYLVSASGDCSVRIWDLESNQQVGDPLWHHDYVYVVAMSPDEQYFASATAGPDAKIYVWNLEEAIRHARGVGNDADPESNAKLKANQSRP
ncbi:WD40 repeat-like protein [Suillus hirtellus]|nr:WD40 repeat-like protein [Suillus hirtellus]